MYLLGLSLKRISAPANFPEYKCEKHGAADIACVQYGTGIEASDIEHHMFCARCMAEDLSRAFAVKKVDAAIEGDPPKIPLKKAG